MDAELKKKLDEIDTLFARFKKIVESQDLPDGERYDANAVLGAILLNGGLIIASRPRRSII